MNPKRDYIVTVISVFLALGIGILIGASLSDNVIVRQQGELVERMEKRIFLLNDKITSLQEDNDILNKELVSWMKFQEKIIPEYVGSRLEGFKIAVIYESGDQEIIDPVMSFLESAGIQVQGRVKVNAQEINNSEKINLQGKTYYLGQAHQRKEFLKKISSGISSYFVQSESEQQDWLIVDEVLLVEITGEGTPDKVLYFPGELEKNCTDLHNFIISSLKNNEACFVSVSFSSADEEQQNEFHDYEVFALETNTILGKLELLHLLESDLQKVVKKNDS